MLLVEVLGGWLSRVEGDKVVRIVQATPDSQPQGTALHKDGRIFITDRRLGVWTYEPKSKVDLLIRYYHGQPFKGPNDLTFDDDGNLYFTDAWQTGADDPSGRAFHGRCCERLPQADKADRQSCHAQWRQGRSRWKFDLCLGAAQKPELALPFDKNNGGLLSCFVSTYFLSGNGPDGLKIDEKGFVYQASFNSQGIYVIDPNHEIVEFIRIPEGRFTTNLAFRPGTKWLYITEAQRNNVWRVEVDNVGLTPWGLR